MDDKKKVLIKTLFLIPFHMPLLFLFLMFMAGLVQELTTISSEIFAVLISIAVELVLHKSINTKLYNLTINVKDSNGLKLSNTIIVLFIILFYVVFFTLPQIL